MPPDPRILDPLPVETPFKNPGYAPANGTLSDRISVSTSTNISNEYGNVTRMSVNLTITNASREDTGVYMCSANNSVGSDSKSINITVQCKLVNHNALL